MKLLGKDAPLEESIFKMRSKLEEMGLPIEEVSWLNPTPNVWSVHIRSLHAPTVFTNGKGASKEAALASALGEFFERLGCNYFFADFYLGEKEKPFLYSEREKWFDFQEFKTHLPESCLSFYNVKQLKKEDLIALQSERDAICSLPFVNQKEEKQYYFPIQLINNLYASNGMAAGNTIAEARTQALSECFERHVKNKIIAEGIRLPEIPESYITSFLPEIHHDMEQLRSEGFKLVALDASLGGVYPVTAIALFNPKNSGCFVSFGAHPKFKVAFERTFTELLQGRGTDQLDQFPTPTFDLDELSDPLNLEAHFVDSTGVVGWQMFSAVSDFEFTPWNLEGSTEEEFKSLVSCLDKLDRDLFIADYDHLGIPVCHILIPNFSEVYPVDDLLFDNSNRAISIRPLLEKWIKQPENQTVMLDLAEQIIALELYQMEPVKRVLGINADPNSPWFDLRIGELLALLYLGMGDYESAFEYCLPLAHAEVNPEQMERVHFYKAVLALLQIKLDGHSLDDYKNSLTLFFGETCYLLAKAHVEQSAFGYHLLTIENLLDFNNHRKLIAFYEQSRSALKAN